MNENKRIVDGVNYQKKTDNGVNGTKINWKRNVVGKIMKLNIAFKKTQKKV